MRATYRVHGGELRAPAPRHGDERPLGLGAVAVAVLAAVIVGGVLTGCPERAGPPPAQVKIGPSGLAEKVSPYKLDSLGTVPEFSLLDQTGAAVTQADLLGTPWLGDFMFTSCPDICPTLSARLSGVQHQWQARIHIVSFSVDPGTDTPAKLAEYALRFDSVPPHWRFLTGDVAAMKTVVVGGFKQMMEKAPATGEAPETVLHGSRFVLVDKTGVIRAYPDPELPGEIEGFVDELLKSGG